MDLVITFDQTAVPLEARFLCRLGSPSDGKRWCSWEEISFRHSRFEELLFMEPEGFQRRAQILMK